MGDESSFIDPCRRLELPAIGKSQDQDQSLFIARLPTEIRLRIYELCVGLRNIHWFLCDPRREPFAELYLQDVRGPEVKKILSERNGELWDKFSTCTCSLTCGPVSEHIRIMRVLLACRTFYKEAIDLVYTSNWFVMNYGAPYEWIFNSLPVEKTYQLRRLALKLKQKTTKCLLNAEQTIGTPIETYKDVRNRFPQLQYFEIYSRIVSLDPSEAKNVPSIQNWFLIKDCCQEKISELGRDLRYFAIYVEVNVEISTKRAVPATWTIRGWCKVQPGKKKMYLDSEMKRRLSQNLVAQALHTRQEYWRFKGVNLGYLENEYDNNDNRPPSPPLDKTQLWSSSLPFSD